LIYSPTCVYFYVEIESGVWNSKTDDTKDVQKLFLQAIEQYIQNWLTRNRHIASDFASDFYIENGLLKLNELKFVFRSLSTTRTDDFHETVDDGNPALTINIDVELIGPQNGQAPDTLNLCIQFFMMSQSFYSNLQFPPISSWRQLYDIPDNNSDEVVDVWSFDDGIVPRIVSDTKFNDIFPHFIKLAKGSKRQNVTNQNMEEKTKDEDEEKEKEEEDDEKEEDEDETLELQITETKVFFFQDCHIITLIVCYCE